MRAPALLAAVLLLGAPTGCNPARSARPRPVPTVEPGERPSGSALRELVELSEVVIKGKVLERLEERTGTIYRVRVIDVIVDRRGSGPRPDHPLAEQETIGLTTFLYRRDRSPASIRELDELARYVFFIAPTQDAGEWLHLTDPAPFRLPEAEEGLAEVQELAGGERE